MIHRLWLIFQFFPLSLFVLIAKNGGFSGEAWEKAFISGGILASLETGVLIWRKKTLDRLLLAANAYLMLGAVAFYLNWGWVLGLYSKLQASALFAAITIVGLVTTFFTARGFIGASHSSARSIKVFSLVLLGITVFCGIFSMNFIGNVTLSGTVPVIALILAKKYLASRLALAGSTH